MSTPSDVEVALAFAADHLEDLVVELPDERLLVRQHTGAGADQWIERDVRPVAAGPRRAIGTVQVHTAASFLDAIQRLTITPPTVYVDEDAMSLTAVLNDDDAGGNGWRDHRVALALRRTPPWEAWLKGQGLGDQQRFAERIEDGELEIVAPTPAEMLELAQTFHATTEAKFKSGTRLSSGQTQFVYEEEVKATGGVSPGSITIPERFSIKVRPFVGSDPFGVEARFRYRLKGGDLQMGYELIRAEDVEREAFLDVVKLVIENAPIVPGINVLHGPAVAPA